MTKERTYAVGVETPMYRTHWVWAKNAKEAREKIAALIVNRLDEGELIASIGEGEGAERITDVRRDAWFGPLGSVREAPERMSKGTGDD